MADLLAMWGSGSPARSFKLMQWETRSLNYWTTRKAPQFDFYSKPSPSPPCWGLQATQEANCLTAPILSATKWDSPGSYHFFTGAAHPCSGWRHRAPRCQPDQASGAGTVGLGWGSQLHSCPFGDAGAPDDHPWLEVLPSLTPLTAFPPSIPGHLTYPSCTLTPCGLTVYGPSSQTET